MSCVQVFPQEHCAAWGVLSLTLSAPGAPGPCLGDLREDKASHPWVQPDSLICAHSCVSKGERNFSDTLEGKKLCAVNSSLREE